MMNDIGIEQEQPDAERFVAPHKGGDSADDECHWAPTENNGLKRISSSVLFIPPRIAGVFIVIVELNFIACWGMAFVDLEPYRLIAFRVFSDDLFGVFAVSVAGDFENFPLSSHHES